LFVVRKNKRDEQEGFVHGIMQRISEFSCSGRIDKNPKSSK
jgi:hypothetical protein